MIQPGTRIGGLLIEELLGRGAMGEVYRAQQVSLKRPVAVKRVADHLLGNPDMVARFEREAQVIARIQNQNVVAVYEFGEYADAQGAKHFLLVLELVEGGRNLKQFMGGGPMDWRIASSVILQVAEGLAAAQEQGVVHRDIKPDNIMLTGKGVAKLTDFGLAKAVDSTAMTMGGTLMGTPAYMPPEACRGEAIDQRGDLYSLGATWFHLLSGHVPFRAETTLGMLRAHVDDPVPNVLSLFPAVPGPIADLVRRCLAKQPEDRPASAQQLANELMALVAEGIHLKRAVPELIGTPGGAAEVPGTIATVVSGTAVRVSKTAATAIPGASVFVDESAAARAQQATVHVPPPAQPAESSSSSGAALAAGGGCIALLIGAAVLVVAAVIGVVMMYNGDKSAPAATTPVTASPTTTPVEAKPVEAKPAAPAIALATPTTPAPTVPVPETPAKPVNPPKPLDPPAKPVVLSKPVEVVPPKPVEPPLAAVVPASVPKPSEPSLAAPVPKPVDPVLPTPPVAAPVFVITRVPPPTLAKPAVPAAGSGPAVDVDKAVADFRAAVRRNEVARATGLLGSVSGDTAGYKDMVKNLTAMRAKQDAVASLLTLSVAAEQPAKALSALTEVAAWPDLARAATQTRAWVAEVEREWDKALVATLDAAKRGDKAAAQAILVQVPVGDGTLTPAYQTRRAQVAAQVDALP